VDRPLGDRAHPVIPPEERVFVNRNLRLDRIDVVGFDMDYTLAIYVQPEMDRLSVEATVDKLVALRGYPPEIRELPCDCAFPIRGLIVDKRHGHLLKMDRYRYVAKAYHGHDLVSKEDRERLYQQTKIEPADDRFHWIDTLYALPEAALYAALVPFLEARGELDHAKLFEDIRECIDLSHKDDSILPVMLAGPARYFFRDPKLPATLHKLRSAGKRLFLLTNSQRDYTDRMMTWLLDGGVAGYPSWHHYFDAVVVDARKPSFFTTSRPFLERGPDGLREAPGDGFERGRIYEQGNLRELERRLETGGDRVLYVGDHIYGDILRSKKHSTWRTAMIIQEMDQELRASGETSEARQSLDDLEERRARREERLRWHQAELKRMEKEGNGERGGSDDDARRELRKEVDALRLELRDLGRESRALEAEIDRRYHPAWGSLFRDGTEESLFGKQVEEYACVYTSRVSNLLGYSATQYFRSPRDRMPHET